jgi:hypothetical protein
MFAEHTGTPATPIEPSIRQGVVRTAARTADAATFETLRRLLRESGNQEDDYLYGGAMILVRDPEFVLRILHIGLTDEWPPGSASWYMRNVGYYSGRPGLARDFIIENFAAVQGKARRADRSWILPATNTGFNQRTEADALLADQRRLVGDEAIVPAQQVAELIREKASIREREAARLPELLRSLTARRQQVAVSAP